MEASLALRKFLCGGTAGCITWFACYPMDTVKSKMQTYEGPERLKMRTVIRDLVKDHGIRRLYRGIHVQLMRAFPTSASSLLVYETIKGTLQKRQGLYLKE